VTAHIAHLGLHHAVLNTGAGRKPPDRQTPVRESIAAQTNATPGGPFHR
jgi:hypothetical protein